MHPKTKKSLSTTASNNLVVKVHVRCIGASNMFQTCGLTIADDLSPSRLLVHGMILLTLLLILTKLT